MDRTPFITTDKINPTELPTVKVESVVFLETLACFYQTTQQYTPEDSKGHRLCHENISTRTALQNVLRLP